jgi:hypothetical protein
MFSKKMYSGSLHRHNVKRSMVPTDASMVDSRRNHVVQEQVLVRPRSGRKAGVKPVFITLDWQFRKFCRPENSNIARQVGV